MEELASPPQARCARHNDEAGVHLCPRCGDGACPQCWSGDAGLCLVCAARDPMYGVAPLAWEDKSQSLRARVYRTGLTLLQPATAARSFARGSVLAALTFWCCVTLPLACLAAVIPLTHTLLFMPTLTIKLIGAPSVGDVVWDVVRAMLGGALTNLVLVASVWLSVSFGSLFGARRVWFRWVLYWSWLPSVIQLSMYLPTWLALPLGWLTLLTWPLVLVWWVSQWYVARVAASFGWLRTLLTVCVVSTGAFVGLGFAILLFAWIAPEPVP